MKSIVLFLLLLGHGFTQIGLSLPDETWRPWMQSNLPHAVTACTVTLFTLRLLIDLGICFWVLGLHHRLRGWAENQRGLGESPKPL